MVAAIRLAATTRCRSRRTIRPPRSKHSACRACTMSDLGDVDRLRTVERNGRLRREEQYERPRYRPQSGLGGTDRRSDYGTVSCRRDKEEQAGSLEADTRHRRG